MFLGVCGCTAAVSKGEKMYKYDWRHISVNLIMLFKNTFLCIHPFHSTIISDVSVPKITFFSSHCDFYLFGPPCTSLEWWICLTWCSLSFALPVWVWPHTRRYKVNILPSATIGGAQPDPQLGGKWLLVQTLLKYLVYLSRLSWTLPDLK